MDNEINLLDVFNLNKAFIESVGYEVEGIGSHEYKERSSHKHELSIIIAHRINISCVSVDAWNH